MLPLGKEQGKGMVLDLIWKYIPEMIGGMY
jgi:hypothetical protein